MMTEFRVSGRSDLDAGEAGVRRSDAPLDVAMEMMTAAKSISAETGGATRFEPMEGNDKRKWRMRSEAPAAHTNWRSHMDRC